MNLPTLIGFLGVLVVLAAYALLTTGRLRPDDWRYPIINILGTLGIIVSLFAQWNLPSMVTQLIWIAVSIVGLMRIAMKKKA